MEFINQDFEHLSSFRKGDIVAIESAKRYFDNLSQDSLNFLKRMVQLLNIDSIPKDEANFVISMLKSMLRQTSRVLDREQIFKYSNSLIMRYFTVKNDMMI